MMTKVMKKWTKLKRLTEKPVFKFNGVGGEDKVEELFGAKLLMIPVCGELFNT